MKPKKKQKKLRITEADYMLAQRRAARLEEIAEHGRPVSFRKAIHKSKKVYDRKKLKGAGITGDDPALFRQRLSTIRMWRSWPRFGFLPKSRVHCQMRLILL